MFVSPRPRSGGVYAGLVCRPSVVSHAVTREAKIKSGQSETGFHLNNKLAGVENLTLDRCHNANRGGDTIAAPSKYQPNVGLDKNHREK